MIIHIEGVDCKGNEYRNGNETKYLVVVRYDSKVWASMETASWVVNYLDMEDCFSYDEIHVYDVSEIGKVKELTLYGTWHNFHDPLLIKAEDPNGNVVFYGHGSDH